MVKNISHEGEEENFWTVLHFRNIELNGWSKNSPTIYAIPVYIERDRRLIQPVIRYFRLQDYWHANLNRPFTNIS